MNIDESNFQTESNKNKRLIKYVKVRLKDDIYKVLTREDAHWNLASSLIKFANNGYPMYEWLENIDDELEELVDHEIFKEEESISHDKNHTSTRDADILLTLLLVSMYESGSGIHEDEILERWGMLRTSFSLESLRRKGCIYNTKEPEKFSFKPKSEYQASKWAIHEEDENHATIRFKAVQISEVNAPPLEMHRKPTKDDTEYPIGTCWIDKNKEEAFILDEIVHYSFNEKSTAKWSRLYASKWAKDKMKPQSK